jgi:hypothetical protein
VEESDNLEQAEVAATVAAESADFTSHDPVEKAAHMLIKVCIQSI